VTVEIRFVDEAVTELDDAALWYEDRRAGLGVVESIERWPRASPLVGEVSEELEVRQVPVPRFPTTSRTSSAARSSSCSQSPTNAVILGIGATAPDLDCVMRRPRRGIS
jgi:hypothetical protein